MNTDTALRIGEVGSQRTVTLERGEAFFQIKHDSKHPFVVRRCQSPDRRPWHEVFGTAPMVDRVQVALVEGLARIDNFGANGTRSSTLLKPGDVAVATATVDFRCRRKSNLSWPTSLPGVMASLFSTTRPLPTWQLEFNRYNQQKIVIADQAAGRRTINGAFQANDLEAMTNIAREVFGLRVDARERRNSHFTLTVRIFEVAEVLTKGGI